MLRLKECVVVELNNEVIIFNPRRVMALGEGAMFYHEKTDLGSVGVWKLQG